MIQILQSLNSGHPQLGPHSVAAIQWQKQHLRNNRAGLCFQRIADHVLSAIEARKPYTLRLEGPREVSGHYGPYHIAPVWDEGSQCLYLEISNDRVYTPDSHPFLTLGVPVHTLRQELGDYNQPGASANARIRSKMIGADKLRDRLIEQNCTISDSFAAALFEALASILNANAQQDCH